MERNMLLSPAHIPMRIKLSNDTPSIQEFSKASICVKRNGEILDMIDRETALFLHKKRIIHFEPRRKVAFILSSNRDYVYYREHGKCFYCHTSLSQENATMDHLHPRSKGGKGSVHNLVLSCQQCNNLKGSRHVRQFLSNPYNITGAKKIPTHYFITEQALQGFQRFIHNPSCTYREMYYYFFTESLFIHKGNENTYYTSPKIIFVCKGSRIIHVQPNNFGTRFLLFLKGAKRKALQSGQNILYIPALRAINDYRRIHQKQIPLDTIIKRINNALLFERNISLRVKDFSVVIHGKYTFILHKNTVCWIKRSHPMLLARLNKAPMSAVQELGKRFFEKISLSPKAIQQYRSLIRNSPEGKIEMKIRNILFHNSNIYKITANGIILRSSNYLFTIENYLLTNIKPIKPAYKGLIKPSNKRKRLFLNKP